MRSAKTHLFVKGALQQFDYVLTQHLLGNVYSSGDMVFNSVHATHVKKGGTVDIANVEWIDAVIKLVDGYKVAARDAHLIMFGK